MKKNLVPVGLLLLVTSVAYSQNESPTLLSSQSGYDTSKNMVLEWTLGDSAIETITTEDTMFTQGFIQPYSESSKAIVQMVDDILIFPNPVDTHLNVRLLSHDDDNGIVSIDIYNVNGSIIKQFKNGFSLSKTLQLDISDLQSGIYFVRISDATSVLKSHKIIKK